MAEMSFARYGVVLRRPGMKSVLALGLLVRIPVFSANVLLTVHVVTTLGHSYAAAGLVAAAATIAIAISGPWRGRLLDRHGLRRVVLPSTVISAVCWSVAPFVGYVPLLVLVVGLAVVVLSFAQGRDHLGYPMGAACGAGGGGPRRHPPHGRQSGPAR